ncbi:UDP-glycosyltransferase 76C4 [Corchorus olitorius]|uniref:UDP-glycosyltransferase 76C4 n=1 Tax=Corchorus olitorius TaxID=93759 RepID=A0A1R3I199_9ROSI|nr:UDP-glycosyltransferase 76C4 [Corchorus olitorius]
MEDQNIVCLITDGSFHFTQAVADDLKVPRIVLWTYSVAATHPGSSSTLFRNERDHLSMIENIQVPNLPEKFEDFNDLKGLLQDMGLIIQETKASSGVIFNSCEDLEQEAVRKCSLEFPNPIFPIGPFHNHVWKVGVHLERGEIEKAIRRLMVEEQGQEMRDRIKLIKEKMNLCLKPGVIAQHVSQSPQSFYSFGQPDPPDLAGCSPSLHFFDPVSSSFDGGRSWQLRRLESDSRDALAVGRQGEKSRDKRFR